MRNSVRGRRVVSAKLLAIALIYMSFPLSYQVVSIWLFDTDGTIIAKNLLSPGFWLVSFLSIYTSYLLKRARWYSWHLFLLVNLLIFYLNAVNLTYNSSQTGKLQMLGVFALVQLAFAIVVTIELRVPYFTPRVKWWESDPRYQLSVPVTIRLADGAQAQWTIVDLSRGGCFIKTEEHLPLGTEALLEFSLNTQVHSCVGRVMSQSPSTVTHPKGLGIKFVGMSRAAVKALRQSLGQLSTKVVQNEVQIRPVAWQAYIEAEMKYRRRRRHHPEEGHSLEP